MVQIDRLGFFGEAEALGAILRAAGRDRYIIILFGVERDAGSNVEARAQDVKV